VDQDYFADPSWKIGLICQRICSAGSEMANIKACAGRRKARKGSRINCRRFKTRRCWCGYCELQRHLHYQPQSNWKETTNIDWYGLRAVASVVERSTLLGVINRSR